MTQRISRSASRWYGKHAKQPFWTTYRAANARLRLAEQNRRVILTDLCVGRTRGEEIHTQGLPSRKSARYWYGKHPKQPFWSTYRAASARLRLAEQKRRVILTDLCVGRTRGEEIHTQGLPSRKSARYWYGKHPKQSFWTRYRAPDARQGTAERGELLGIQDPHEGYTIWQKVRGLRFFGACMPWQWQGYQYR